jgi:hypothetical protein
MASRPSTRGQDTRTISTPAQRQHARRKVVLPADFLSSAPHAHMIPTAESFKLIFTEDGNPELLTVSSLTGGPNYCDYPKRIVQSDFRDIKEIWAMLITYRFVEAMTLADEEQQRPAAASPQESFARKSKFWGHLTDDEWMARCFVVGYLKIISACPLYFQRRWLEGRKHKALGFAALRRVLDRYGFSKEKKPLDFLTDWDSKFELKWINAMYKDHCIAHFVRQNNMSPWPRSSQRGDVEERVEEAMGIFKLSRLAIYEALQRDREWYPCFHFDVK